MSKPAYAPGDRIVCTGFLGGPGRVVKCSPKTALIRRDDRNEDERVYLDALRPETAEDVAKREHADAMEAWTSARPKTGIAGIEYGSGYHDSNDELGAQVHRARTPAEMRQAADELHLLADWFERKPVRP